MSGTAGYGALSAAIAHGFCIVILIIAYGHISGGHFNPAVTLAVMITGEIHWILGLLYWLAQLSGGFIGALFVRASLDGNSYMTISGGTTNMNLVNANVAQAIVCEAILTFVLVNSVLNAAVDSGGKNVLAPFGIGVSLMISIFAAGNVSGCSLNPARSLGPAVAYSIFYDSAVLCGGNACLSSTAVWKYHYIHWVGPNIGAAIAALFYKLILGSNGKRWILNH